MRSIEYCKSVLAALLGVQSEKHRQRDFQQGSAVKFILVGVCLIAVFVFTLLALVQWILSTG